METLKYIVHPEGGRPFGTVDRPTQEDMRGLAEGLHVLHKSDGSVSKVFRVYMNKAGNESVQGINPEPPDSLSTLNLQRMLKDYTRIVKLWPKSASAREYRKLVEIVKNRCVLVALAETYLVPSGGPIWRGQCPAGIGGQSAVKDLLARDDVRGRIRTLLEEKGQQQVASATAWLTAPEILTTQGSVT